MSRGRFYLRNSRVAEGIEILKKLSRFHELNSERMLALGDAYLNVGRANEAADALSKGEKLTGGQDERFKDGLVKVDLLKGDMQAALAKIGKKYLSAPVLAFLNTRAVMAARAGMMDEGVKLYNEALAGCDPVDKVIVAKLWFNMGIAFVRARQLEKATDSLAKSVEIGGSDFDRAVNPLAVARQVLAKKSSGASAGDLSSASQVMEEIEFESFK